MELESEQPRDRKVVTVTVVDRKKAASAGRSIENIDELVEALNALPRSHSAQAGQLRIQARAVDFVDLSFREQLALVRRTDVLVGAHGAGLTHALFLPPGAHLIEYATGGGNHFDNLARYSGVRYHALEFTPMAQRLDPVALADAVASFLAEFR